MRVSLIDYTGAGDSQPANYAAAVLIFTKSTRLEMKPDLFDTILRWTMAKKEKELEYMAKTIPSSWEFCNYTFMIEGVTRAFTHQLVRTRTASFAQQTMRVLNVDGWDYATGPSIEGDKGREEIYNDGMVQISNAYAELQAHGTSIEDARGILPTNILTNIVMGANLRTMTEMIRKRSSPRTQGEYRSVIDGLKEQIVMVHPWTKLFFDRSFDKAAQELDDEVMEIKDQNKRIRMIKLVDQLRQG